MTKSFLNILDLVRQFQLTAANYHEFVFPAHDSKHFNWYPENPVKRLIVECDDFSGAFDVNTETGEIYWGQFIMSEYDGRVPKWSESK
jgi:hypothetical protein